MMMKDAFNACIAREGRGSYLSILVLQTDCFITIENHPIQGYDGDIVLLKKDMHYQSDKAEGFLVFDFEEDLFDSLFYAQTADCKILYDFMLDDSERHEYLYFSVHERDEITPVLSLLKHESACQDVYHEKMARLLVVGLFTLLDRSHDETLIVAKSTMISDNRFGRIMKYIGDNFQTVTLQNTAEKFGYNPDYLSTRFKMITGETFRHKLLSIRLEKAADLLLSTEMTIDEISEAVGFHDKSWFMRKFKERYEMTPHAYRKSHG